MSEFELLALAIFIIEVCTKLAILAAKALWWLCTATAKVIGALFSSLYRLFATYLPRGVRRIKNKIAQKTATEYPTTRTQRHV